MPGSQSSRDRADDPVGVLRLAVDVAVRALRAPGADRLPVTVSGRALSDFVAVVRPVREALREAAAEEPDGRLPVALSFIRNALTHAQHGEALAARNAFVAAWVALEQPADECRRSAPHARH